MLTIVCNLSCKQRRTEVKLETLAIDNDVRVIRTTDRLKELGEMVLNARTVEMIREEVRRLLEALEQTQQPA